RVARVVDRDVEIRAPALAQPARPDAAEDVAGVAHVVALELEGIGARGRKVERVFGLQPAARVDRIADVGARLRAGILGLACWTVDEGRLGDAAGADADLAGVADEAGISVAYESRIPGLAFAGGAIHEPVIARRQVTILFLDVRPAAVIGFLLRARAGNSAAADHRAAVRHPGLPVGGMGRRGKADANEPEQGDPAEPRDR